MAANYPRVKVPAPKTLPEDYSFKGQEKRLVWRVEGEIHGFLSTWEATAVMTEKLRRWGEMGNANAARDAKLFEQMGRARLDLIKLWVYTSAGVERTIKRGDVVVTFADGTSQADDGMILYAPMSKGTRPASTAKGLVRLAGSDDPEIDGRAMYVFLPAGNLDKSVAAISLREPE